MTFSEREEAVRQLLRVEGASELPPVPKGHLDVLEPLSPQELLRCYREANLDRYHHVRERHPDEGLETTVDTMLGHVMEKLAQHADRGEVDDSTLEGLRWAASRAVSRYRAHVTEGHTAPNESEDEYLRRLVGRVHRRDLG